MPIEQQPPSLNQNQESSNKEQEVESLATNSKKPSKAAKKTTTAGSKKTAKKDTSKDSSADKNLATKEDLAAKPPATRSKKSATSGKKTTTSKVEVVEDVNAKSENENPRDKAKAGTLKPKKATSKAKGSTQSKKNTEEALELSSNLNEQQKAKPATKAAKSASKAKSANLKKSDLVNADPISQDANTKNLSIDGSNKAELSGEGINSKSNDQGEASPVVNSYSNAENTQATSSEAQNLDEQTSKDESARKTNNKRKNANRRKKQNAKKHNDANLDSQGLSETQDNSLNTSESIELAEVAKDLDNNQNNLVDNGHKLEDKKGESSKEAAAKVENKKIKSAKRKMFVCVRPEEQIEVVLTEEGQVQEYYVEMINQVSVKGNIYRGVIHNIDNNLQAAFVNFGSSKNGFLQIDEVHPEYYNVMPDLSRESKYPPIQKVLKVGQEVLVQVVKEPTGTKGAFLTTYLSIPGRFLVLTPGSEQIGVSRKVENEAERNRLKKLLNGLNPGHGLGVIIRTASEGNTNATLKQDLEYLKKTWEEVRAKGTNSIAPALIYQAHNLISRATRDYLTEAVTEVWVDDEDVAKAVSDIASVLFPKKKSLVKVHLDNVPLFERFNLQKQLNQIQSREVTLPSGGCLIFDHAEALTAIDINSAKSGGKQSFEDMAYRTNLEAASMIPLQLRLRDIGGQVVVDFIEMKSKNHWREIEKAMHQGMKLDKARYDIGKISAFGLMEIVRQRLGSSAISVSSEPCPHCKGTGVRRNMEWQSQQALREISQALRSAANNNLKQISHKVQFELALHLLNAKRNRLLELEQQWGILLTIEPVYS